MSSKVLLAQVNFHGAGGDKINTDSDHRAICGDKFLTLKNSVNALKETQLSESRAGLIVVFYYY